MEVQSKRRNIILTVILLLVIAVSTSVIVLIMFSAQQNNKSSKTNNLTTEDIVSQVVKKMNYQNLSQISSENISKYYDIPQDTVTDSAMYISNRADSGIEFACFKLRNENDEEILMSAISDYLNTKNSTYKEVNSKSSQTKIDTVFPYVFVAVSSDSETAVRVFKDIITDRSDMN